MERRTQPQAWVSSLAKFLPFLAGAAFALFLRERLIHHPLEVREMWLALGAFLRAFVRTWIPGLPAELVPLRRLLARVLAIVAVALSATNQAVVKALVAAVEKLQ